MGLLVTVGLEIGSILGNEALANHWVKHGLMNTHFHVLTCTCMYILLLYLHMYILTYNTYVYTCMYLLCVIMYIM